MRKDSGEQSFQELYQKGEVVWAKVSGHPWWPAYAIDDNADDQEERYHVVFFGDQSSLRAQLAFACVKPFQDFFDDFSSRVRGIQHMEEAIDTAIAQLYYNGVNVDEYLNWKDTVEKKEKGPQEDQDSLYNPESDINKAPKSKPGQGKPKPKRKEAQLSEHEGPEAQGEKDANQPRRGRGRSRKDEKQEKKVARSISKQDVSKSAQKYAPHSIRQRSYLEEREKMLNTGSRIFSSKQLRSLVRSWKRQKVHQREEEKEKILYYLETIDIEPGDVEEIKKVTKALESEEKDERLLNLNKILQQTLAKEKKDQEEKKIKLAKEYQQISHLLNKSNSEGQERKEIRRRVAKKIWKAFKTHPMKQLKEVAVEMEELIFNRDKKMSQTYNSFAIDTIKGLHDHKDPERSLKQLKSKSKSKSQHK